MKAMHRAQEAQAHATGSAQADVGALRVQVEHEIVTRVASETKTTTALDAILTKIQNSDVKADMLQHEMQEQKKEVSDMGEKLNAVLAEVQALGLQFGLMSRGGMDINPENTKGANWNLNDQNMDEKPAPQSIPPQGEKNLVSPAGVAPQKESSSLILQHLVQ